MFRTLSLECFGKIGIIPSAIGTSSLVQTKIFTNKIDVTLSHNELKRIVEAANRTWYPLFKKHTIVRKTKYTNAATKSTRFIFCFVVFVSGERNFIFADFRFADFATSFDTGVVNRKLRNRQNENRRKQNFARQKQIQNHQKHQNKK